MDLEELQKYKTEHVQTSKLINNLHENIGNFIIFVLRYLDERYGDGNKVTIINALLGTTTFYMNIQIRD